MQPIRDKDFDQLFKNAFDDAEITPSNDFWNGINAEIAPKKKRIIPVYWWAAAVILIVTTVAILTNQQTANKPSQLVKQVNEKMQKVDRGEESVLAVVKPIEVLKDSVRLVAKSVRRLEKVNILVNVKEKDDAIVATQVKKPETVTASIALPKNEVKTKVEEPILSPKEETVLAVVANPIPAEEVYDGDKVESRGIRNVGDVVNLIVNTVDKRKDKFIQFKNDDGESSLASINIGPFKIGRRNR